GLTTGHQYRVEAVASDNVGHTTTSAVVTLGVDDTAATLTTPAPSAGTNAAAQHYDSGTKTYWVNGTASGTFTLNATVTDGESGINTVTFPDFSGSGTTSGTNAGSGSSYHSTATYSFSSPSSNPGSKTISATNNVIDP